MNPLAVNLTTVGKVSLPAETGNPEKGASGFAALFDSLGVEEEATETVSDSERDVEVDLVPPDENPEVWNSEEEAPIQDSDPDPDANKAVESGQQNTPTANVHDDEANIALGVETPGVQSEISLTDALESGESTRAEAFVMLGAMSQAAATIALPVTGNTHLPGIQPKTVPIGMELIPEPRPAELLSSTGRLTATEVKNVNLVLGTDLTRGQVPLEGIEQSDRASLMRAWGLHQKEVHSVHSRVPETNSAVAASTAVNSAPATTQIAEQSISNTGSFVMEDPGHIELSSVGRDPSSSVSLRTETVLATIQTGSADLGLTRADSVRQAASNAVDILVRQPGKPVEVSLNPEELGRVRMALSTSETGITVIISSERAETLDLLRRHIDQLAQEFKQLGYENTSFEFSQDSENGSERPDEPPESLSTDQNNNQSAKLAYSSRLVPAGLDLRL